MNIRLISMVSVLAIASFAQSDTFYLALKANTMSMNYSEKDNGNLLDTEKSKFFGNIGGYSIDASANVAKGFLGADATKLIVNYEYDEGNSNYTGSILGLGSSYGSYSDMTSNTIQRVQGMVSQVKYTSYGQAMLNLGIGNRNWHRGLTSSQKEDYIWNYWLAGVGFDFNAGKRFTLGVLGYYQRAWAPTMKYNSNTFNNTFNLGTTSGYRIEVPASYQLTQMFSIVGSFTLDNWSIGKSNVMNGYFEPSSTTNNQTLSLGLAAKF